MKAHFLIFIYSAKEGSGRVSAKHHQTNRFPGRLPFRGDTQNLTLFQVMGGDVREARWPVDHGNSR